MEFWYAVASVGPLQTTCTLLETDNHTRTSSLNFAAGYSSWCPANSVKALKVHMIIINDK